MEYIDLNITNLVRLIHQYHWIHEYFDQLKYICETLLGKGESEFYGAIFVDSIIFPAKFYSLNEVNIDDKLIMYYAGKMNIPLNLLSPKLVSLLSELGNDYFRKQVESAMNHGVLRLPFLEEFVRYLSENNASAEKMLGWVKIDWNNCFLDEDDE